VIAQLETQLAQRGHVEVAERVQVGDPVLFGAVIFAAMRADVADADGRGLAGPGPVSVS